MAAGKRRRTDWLGVVFVALHCVSFVTAQSLAKYNLTRPLRICTASIQDFGARCNGAPDAAFEHNEAPNGPVPAGGWCAAGEDFCGYDIDVWSQVAEWLNLEEGVDFERVCLGEAGFQYMMESLVGTNTSNGTCDIGVSSITASTERENRGITFSRATHRSALAILVHAPLKTRGMWAFFEPLHFYVWMALLGTIVVVPFFVFFFEAVFAKWTSYMNGEKLDIASGLVQCLWHSISHTLSIDVFHVRSFPARIITAAYAFLVLILTNTYTANLAAFLTVNQLDTTIDSVDDLRGKSVATVEPYIHRLYENHRISASSADGWDYDRMIEKLRAGDYVAVISDDTQLIGRAYADDSCSLHLLGDTIEPFDLAFAFARDFPSPSFRFAVSSALLSLQEGGVLSELKEEHEPPEPQCASEATEFSETNQVAITSLWGLWIILAIAVVIATGAGAAEYALKRRQRHEDAAKMEERAAVFRSVIPKAASVTRATSAFWNTIDGSRRTRASTADGVSSVSKAAPPAKGVTGLWNRAAKATKGATGGVAGSDVAAATPSAAPPPIRGLAPSRCSTGSCHTGLPLGASDSVRSSEILDVFTFPPSAHTQMHGGSLPHAIGTEGARVTARTESASSCRRYSRQTSHGSANPTSLGARSTGCRSENLDAPVETQPPDPDALSQGVHSAGMLHGLPLACLDMRQEEATLSAGIDGREGQGAEAGADPGGDLDAELDELNLIVEAVAGRVAALRRMRQHQKQLQG